MIRTGLSLGGRGGWSRLISFELRGLIRLIKGLVDREEIFSRIGETSRLRTWLFYQDVIACQQRGFSVFISLLQKQYMA